MANKPPPSSYLKSPQHAEQREVVLGKADGEIADTGEPAVTVRPKSLAGFYFNQLVQTAASWLASEVNFQFSL